MARKTDPNWHRIPGISGGTTGVRHQHLVNGKPSGWVVIHCGHPTALWPYYIVRPDGEMILAPSNHGFQHVADAKKAVLRLVAGESKSEFIPGKSYSRLTSWDGIWDARQSLLAHAN